MKSAVMAASNMKVLSVFIFLPVLRDVCFQRASGLEAVPHPLYMYSRRLRFKKGANPWRM